MQTKKGSLSEVVISTLIGFLVSLFLINSILPYYGFLITTGQSVEITLIFTIVSIIRAYFVRRFFNLFIIKGINS